MTRRPDYELIHRLMDQNVREQDEYITRCPHLEAIRELRNEYSLEYWWGRVPEWPGNGMAEVLSEDALIISDTISGEIDVR